LVEKGEIRKWDIRRRKLRMAGRLGRKNNSKPIKRLEEGFILKKKFIKNEDKKMWDRLEVDGFLN